jgi:hypothetical protein
MKQTGQRRAMTLLEVLVIVGIVLTLLASTARLGLLLWDWPHTWDDLRDVEAWQVLLLFALIIVFKRWEARDNTFK